MLSNRLTIKEALQYLKTIYDIDIVYTTFKNWCYIGKIPSEKKGSLYLINPTSLDKFGKNFRGLQKGGRMKWALRQPFNEHHPLRGFEDKPRD